MSRVRIVTHTGCDLPYQDAANHNIIMLPDIVIFGETQYRNNIDILPEAFYSRISNDNEQLPTSSHPNAAAFLDAFRLADSEEILCITNTSKMAGTYNTASLAARLAEEEIDEFHSKIYVYDSQQISFGMALLVLEAAKMAESGASAQEIIQALDELLPKIGVYFIMKSLKYARRGGRVGAIKALTADALGVKPSLVFRDGTVTDLSLNRTFKHGIQSIFQKYCRYASPDSEVYIFHANNEKDALILKKMIQDEFPNVSPRIEWVGPVIGLYTGNGCVGISFKKKDV